jgi:hypothetical protein
VLIAGAAAAGCGGGNGGAKTTATATATAAAKPATTTATVPAPPTTPGSIQEAEQRLRQAGYTVTGLDVNPPALAARKVGDQVLMYEYASTAAAIKGRDEIRRAVAQRPNRGVAVSAKRRVYFLGQPHAITPAERKSFQTLVGIAEGR